MVYRSLAFFIRERAPNASIRFEYLDGRQMNELGQGDEGRVFSRLFNRWDYMGELLRWCPLGMVWKMGQAVKH